MVYIFSGQLVAKKIDAVEDRRFLFAVKEKVKGTAS